MERTWTEKEMKERLEGMGYDLKNDEGEHDEGLLTEIASMLEGYKWDDEKEVWYE